MASPKAIRWRALVIILLIAAAMWGGILYKGWSPLLGLDLQGGISVVLAPKDGQQAQEEALEQAVEIIRNRVDALGVAEPDIARQGENIVVQIAGIKAEEQERAFDLIGTTAQLRFRPVLEVIPPSTAAKPGEIPNCADPDTFPEDDPAKPVVFCVRPETAPGQQEPPPAEWDRLRLGPVALEGTGISGATAQAPTGQLGALTWFVQLDLTRQGARDFAEVTGRLACNRNTPPTDQLAIVLDRYIESHPQMGEGVECGRGITGGQAVIEGNFSESEAKDLALILRYGALPLELEPVTTTTVSPTLGRESLESGLLAGLIGVAIVFVYVLFFYRALGFIIWLGIGVHAVITFGVIILLGETAGFALSLAGIAGLIVSLGIAADSFIVYFERIKDEVLSGKSVRASIDRAWSSARRTILAADLVTALAAVVLYVLAVGNVKGFALMLGLATLLDLVVSFWFMHPAVWLLAQTRVLGESKTLGMGGVGGGALATEGSRA